MEKIKFIFINFLLIFCILISSLFSKTKIIEKYIQFERLGGGDVLFNCQKINNTKYDFLVIRYGFKDLGLHFVENTGINKDMFDVVDKILMKKESVEGVLKKLKPGMVSGTWLHIYLIDGKKKTEITNQKLIDKLQGLENLVRDKVKKELHFN